MVAYNYFVFINAFAATSSRKTFRSLQVCWPTDWRMMAVTRNALGKVQIEIQSLECNRMAMIEEAA